MCAIARRWSAVGVNGSECSSQRALRSGGPSSGSARAPLAPAGAPELQRELEQQQLFEREPDAAALVIAEVCGAERAGAIGQPLGHAQRGRQGLDHLGERPAVLAHEGEDLGRAQPLRGRVGRDLGARRPDRLAGRRV
jgi:hypothetical protein